jgi:hypothetical protein
MLLPIIYAADTWNDLQDTDVATIGSLAGLFKNVLVALGGFAGVVLFVMVVASGFTFLFSGGDAKQLEKAKGTFTAALTGLVLIAVSYLILLLIGQFTGVDVTKFDLNIQK